jgi:hypothetical protein
MDGKTRNIYKILADKSKLKMQLRKSEGSWEDNIKPEFREI